MSTISRPMFVVCSQLGLPETYIKWQLHSVTSISLCGAELAVVCGNYIKANSR